MSQLPEPAIAAPDHPETVLADDGPTPPEPALLPAHQPAPAHMDPPGAALPRASEAASESVPPVDAVVAPGPPSASDVVAGPDVTGAPNAPDTPGPAGDPSAIPTPASWARFVLGVALGAAVAALGGLILGEYPFTGSLPYIAGVLFALVVAEVILSIGRRPGLVTALAAAACTVGGLAMGVWISVGEGVAPLPPGGWVAVVVGAVVALLRGGLRFKGARPPKSSSQPTS